MSGVFHRLFSAKYRNNVVLYDYTNIHINISKMCNKYRKNGLSFLAMSGYVEVSSVKI